jgi:hypothetical protein
MPKPRKKEEIKCRYFRWLLGQRSNVYYADGRANDPSLGRQSLGTKDRKEAEEQIHELDLKMAVKYGRADRSLLATERDQLLEFQAGRELYEKHVNRPAVAGGPRKSTSKHFHPRRVDPSGNTLPVGAGRYWIQGWEIALVSTFFLFGVRQLGRAGTDADEVARPQK